MTSIEVIQRVGNEVQGDPDKMESAKQSLYRLVDDFMQAKGPFSTAKPRYEAADGSEGVIVESSEHHDVFQQCFVDVATSCKISVSSLRYLFQAFFVLLGLTFWPCVFFLCCAGCVNRIFKYVYPSKKIPIAKPRSSKKEW